MRREFVASIHSAFELETRAHIERTLATLENDKQGLAVANSKRIAKYLEKEAQLRLANQEIGNLMQSHSWKVTAPLRLIWRAVQNLSQFLLTKNRRFDDDKTKS